MSYLDLIILIPLAWAGFKGFKKGFILEVFSLLALFAGIYSAIQFSNYAADFLKDELKIVSDYLPIISFAVTFLAVVIGVYFLGKAVQKVVHIASLEILNRIAGAVFSILKTTLIFCVLIFFLQAADQKMQIIPKEEKEKSMLYIPLLKLSVGILPAIKETQMYEHYKRWKDDNPSEKIDEWEV